MAAVSAPMRMVMGRWGGGLVGRRRPGNDVAAGLFVSVRRRIGGGDAGSTRPGASVEKVVVDGQATELRHGTAGTGPGQAGQEGGQGRGEGGGEAGGRGGAGASGAGARRVSLLEHVQPDRNRFG